MKSINGVRDSAESFCWGAGMNWKEYGEFCIRSEVVPVDKEFYEDFCRALDKYIVRDLQLLEPIDEDWNRP